MYFIYLNVFYCFYLVEVYLLFVAFLTSIRRARVRGSRGRGRGVRTRGGMGREQQVEDRMAQGAVVQRRVRGRRSGHAESTRSGRRPLPTDELDLFICCFIYI